MNWFQRHLNWTVVIIMCATGLVVGFISGIFGLTEEVPFLIMWAAQFPVFGWMLIKMKRRLWNLLWLIIPLGWLILLLLENRSEQKVLEQK